MPDDKKEENNKPADSAPGPEAAGEPLDDGQPPKRSSADIVVEPSGGDDKGFEAELTTSLLEAEKQLASQTVSSLGLESWRKSREIVQGLKPVPWFIWRLSNYVLGHSDRVRPLSEGLVFGLRRLVFAAASDPFIGTGEKVNNIHKALRVLPSDVIAAIAVMHAVCRKLSTMQHARIWRPVLDEAILRSRLGWMLGENILEFGRGRTMLSGFSTRSGLAVLIATGDEEQAGAALESMAAGVEIKELGVATYGCDPAQISSMLLSAAGCGRAASYGIMLQNVADFPDARQEKSELKWFASFNIVESIRSGKEVDPDLWGILDLDAAEVESKLREEAKAILRRGHGWNWLL